MLLYGLIGLSGPVSTPPACRTFLAFSCPVVLSTLVDNQHVAAMFFLPNTAFSCCGKFYVKGSELSHVLVPYVSSLVFVLVACFVVCRLLLPRKCRPLNTPLLLTLRYSVPSEPSRTFSHIQSIWATRQRSVRLRIHGLFCLITRSDD